MRRFALFLIVLLPVLAAVGIAVGQTSPAPAFELVRQIGRTPPQNVQYDPVYDQFAYTDAQSRLVLVNAADLNTRFVLYANGPYNAYAFSHNGQMLAVALGQKVEIWDTQTGKQSLDMEQAVIGLDGPLMFSDDDTLLLFNAVVQAPADVRLSESDTSNVPWLWDLAAQRHERTSILLGNVLAEPFYDLRNGFVLGPENRIAVAKPGVIEIHTISPDGFPVVRQYETTRYERDPMDLWFSLDTGSIYYRPNNQAGLAQFNTDPSKGVFPIPTGRQYQPNQIAPLRNLVRSKYERIIGEANTLHANSFLTLLLGDSYIQALGNHPLTVKLLDILKPVTVGKDQMGMLVYLYDDTATTSTIDFIRPNDILDMAIHPDGQHVAIRRASGSQAVEIYDLKTGNLDLSIVPAVQDNDGSQMLAYNQAGTVLNVGWQRFDAQTGKLLHQDVSYRAPFDQVYFSDDSQSLITFNGSVITTWSLATGEIVRTETEHTQGSLYQTASNGLKTLYSLSGDDGGTAGMQVLDMGTGERRTVTFSAPPGRRVEQVIPSPDWEHYIVTFSANEFSPYYPGNEVALYSLDGGQRWFYAGDDLPSPNNRDYGWVDNQTAYVSGSPDHDQPGRVYGVDYAPSGLPACLVSAFPDTWAHWTDIWERLNLTVSAETLDHLAQRLCDTTDQGEQAVDGLFHPTATPRPPRVTSTPSFVAGLPACLSARYPDQAQQYAQEWRKLTDGLTPDQVNQLQDVLCEGLQQGVNVPSIVPTPGAQDAGPQVSVMTIDVATGKRAFGSTLPPSAPREDALSLVYDQFVQTMGYQPNNALLSPDRTLLAAQTPDGYVAIYRLVRPYGELVATRQAAAQGTLTGQPKLLALAPTATEPFREAGQARPTLTPTVTPTSPPPATQAAPLPDMGKVQEMCADTTLHTVKDLPAGYVTSGRLLTEQDGSNVVWVYDPMTGIGRPDETLIDASQAGQLSFNQDWLLQQKGDVVVSRADGSDPVRLFTAAEAASLLENIHWLDQDTVEYTYKAYTPIVSIRKTLPTLTRDYNAASKTLSDPFMLPPPIILNGQFELQTLEQPDKGALVLVGVPFNAGLNTGYKFYIYDRADGSASYFARSNDGADLNAQWHPLGKALYYHLPGAPTWSLFDPVTRQHSVLGDLPDGSWSRDGRYRVRWINLSNDEIRERVKRNQPILKLSIWDSDTGLTRQYCVPQTGTGSLEGTPYFWSPDNRYLVFQTLLPADADKEAARPSTLILDTQTGSVTDVSFDIGRIIVWTE